MVAKTRKLNRFTAVALLAFSNFTLAATTVNTVQAQENHPTLQQLETLLDRAARATPLSRLGAQWLVLRKSHWQIGAVPMKPEGRLDALGRLRTEVAANPFDSTQSHRLLLPVDSSGKILVNDPVQELENRVFPVLLKGIPIPGTRLNTRHSLMTTLYQYGALEAQNNLLRGASTPDSNQLEITRTTHMRPEWRSLLDRDVLRGRDHEKLLRRFLDLKPCYTSCLEFMESKVIRGFFMGLESDELVSRVHQELNSFYGCYTEGSHFKEIALSNLQLEAQSGADALIGRPIYIVALDQADLPHPDFKGMNGIIRSASPAAARDFASLATLGANPALRIAAGEADEVKNALDALQGVSRLIAEYWAYRRDIQPKIGTKAAQAQAAAKFLERPFFEETFFEPAFAAGPISLKAWVERLFELNPGTPYQMYSYNFFTADYNRRILEAIQNLPTFVNLSDPGSCDSSAASFPGPETQPVPQYSWDELIHNLRDLF